MRLLSCISRFAVILIALSATLSPCAAQGARAPYEADMVRLAEILGALHYLRAICGANEGQTWRNEMQALIDAASDPAYPAEIAIVISNRADAAGLARAEAAGIPHRVVTESDRPAFAAAAASTPSTVRISYTRRKSASAWSRSPRSKYNPPRLLSKRASQSLSPARRSTRRARAVSAKTC